MCGELLKLVVVPGRVLQSCTFSMSQLHRYSWLGNANRCTECCCVGCVAGEQHPDTSGFRTAKLTLLLWRHIQANLETCLLPLICIVEMPLRTSLSRGDRKGDFHYHCPKTEKFRRFNRSAFFFNKMKHLPPEAVSAAYQGWINKKRKQPPVK